MRRVTRGEIIARGRDAELTLALMVVRAARDVTLVKWAADDRPPPELEARILHLALVMESVLASISGDDATKQRSRLFAELSRKTDAHPWLPDEDEAAT